MKEAQLDIVVYPVNCIMELKSAQNTNVYWVDYQHRVYISKKILTAVMIQPAERQVRYKINGIFADRGMDHIQSLGSAMHDA